MPIFRLDERIAFPPPHLADASGLLAIGGDLSPIRLLNAYAAGIFPWYSVGDPILWWSPSPRLVLFPRDLHVSRSMQKILKKNLYRVTVDMDFKAVITHCQAPDKNREDTWITGEMRDAYLQLHRLGFAHSVEVWEENELVGGLYGISLGRCFFGESMFAKRSNASKYGFIRFVQQLKKLKFSMVDCQVATDHLIRLGAKNISRKRFLALLKKSLKHETLRGSWEELEINE